MQDRLDCKICKTNNLVKFLSLGKMSVANAFLKKEDLNKKEYKFELAIGFCENCKMVQLTELVPYEKYLIPDEENKRNYFFFSSTSKFMEKHFAEAAEEIEDRFLKQDSKVLEIGSNDGIMLKAFKNHKVLGIEPSHNVAKVAQDIGIETITEFFTENLAKKIVSGKGKFKVVFSANVILNIHDLHEVIKGVKNLLEDDGVFIFEDPYIIDIISQNAYDQIYDEHVYFFSLNSLSNLFKMHNIEIFDAKKLWTHGGSMRIYVCNKGKYKKTDRLKEYIKAEEKEGINKLETFEKFAKNVEKSKEELVKLLKKLKSEGKKIVGYGASSKGTIVLNYCNINNKIIEYISDSTPSKQGLYSPGMHIPIVSPEEFHKDNADYALLLIWNHAKEVIGKEQDFINRGGKFIVHIPYAKII